MERATGLEPATEHPTNGEPFAGTLPDLRFDAPSAQVEAAGSVFRKAVQSSMEKGS